MSPDQPLLSPAEAAAQDGRIALDAALLKTLRKARGLSQEALAHESGINRTYLSAIERSERNISIDNATSSSRFGRGESRHRCLHWVSCLRWRLSASRRVATHAVEFPSPHE